MALILLLEDDDCQAAFVKEIVTQLGHELCVVHDGRSAVRWFERNTCDVFIVDWMVPEISGYEVLRWVREHLGDNVPVLFLTAKVLEADIVSALDAGADDYLVKPFRRSEFVARVGVLLRRRNSQLLDECSTISHSVFSFDVKSRTLSRRGEPIELTPKEAELTSLFFRNAGKIISRALLATVVWGRGFDPASRTLDTHISRLRRKGGFGYENGLRLISVYTHGYRLDVIAESPGDRPAQCE
ncbi:Sensory transduction protein regX3 [Paraburkholderia aspalathi]|uniref:response regulator transcription factor n=1 Tax=Paraburkholderia aspalathi TaxID=1324617 RepID=UPI0019099D03|nr:response regulator transcription factor [Paraburkholderia aspalathi]MBK3844301.1 response regulator transcription factor [Paraburkholderia aspalathi]CAE6870797.1 Sensory transduction protein regX3 [Paraburkholderia aspalathi]